MTTQTTGLQLLREPFPDHQISYLPKGGVKLAYVGHAALTDRLLNADPNWTWEPLALDARGLPALDDAGGMWIRLTVCGATRLALELRHKGELHQAPDPPAPAVLTAAQVADWLAAIAAASEDELADVAAAALAAATAVKDRDAFVSFRAARNKRKAVTA